MKTDSRCVLPFMHLNVMPDGTVHPCCASSQSVCDESGAPLSIRTHSLKEIWNSSGLREIRRTMLRGGELQHYTDCYRIEKAGFASSRTNYNAKLLGRSVQHVGVIGVCPL